MNNKKTQKNASYLCEICSFKTDNKTDYKSHLTTPKHKNNVNLITNNNEKTQKNAKKRPFQRTFHFFNHKIFRKFNRNITF